MSVLFTKISIDFPFNFLDFIDKKHFRISIFNQRNIDHVLGLFDIAKKYGLKATANIAVTKKNLPELYENIALPLIHGAEYVLLNRFLPGGRGLSNTEYLLSMDETNEMLDIAETVLTKANRFGHVGTELPLCAIKKAGQYRHLQVSSMCAAAKGFFIVDPSGHIKACNHSPKKICHYKEECVNCPITGRLCH